MKRLCGTLLLAVLCLFLARAGAEGTDEIDVTQYSYTVLPVLNPFNKCVYVKTDNPDPLSFRLRDPDSIYADDGSEVLLSQQKALYADVKYEDPTRYRVKGGYIFEASYAKPDGGSLVLQQRVYISGYSGGELYTVARYKDTDMTVTCPALKSGLDVLAERYTSDGMAFFQKLDAIQNALDELAVYPRAVMDSDSPNEKRPYPFLAASPYAELSLNEHYEMYNEHEGNMLLQRAYPYVLDSLGFPGMIASAAKRFEPDCTVESGNNHWSRNITWEGETKSYGGAGKGGYDPINTDRLEQLFSFDGSDSDWGVAGTAEDYSRKLASFEAVAAEDLAEYREQIDGDVFRRTIGSTGGTWVMVAKEGGFDYGESFAYMIPTASGGARTISDAWVDGRYIGYNETFTPGETFAGHPLAGIVVHNVRYTDINGGEHIQDLLYTYDSSRDRWEASGNDFYAGYYGSYQIPDSFILTREQVSAMALDSNTFRMPETGLYYDGRKQPGTVFRCVTATYYGENGLEGPAAKKVGFAELNEPCTLAGGYSFSSPEYPAGQSFKAWLIDGVEYPSEGTYMPTGDFSAHAVWERVHAILTRSWIQGQVACEDGFSGKLYCVHYNSAGTVTAVESAKLVPGANTFTFARLDQGNAAVKIFVADDQLVPVYPAKILSLE